MKIAFDAKRAYCNFTGLGNHSRTTLDILMEYFPENEYLLYTPKVRRCEVTQRYLDDARLVTQMPKGMVRGGLWRSFCMADDARRDGADVFHGLSNELPFGIRRSGMASVVTIHDVAFKTFPDMYHWMDRKIYDRKWRYAVRHADRIIAISECTKRDILRFYDVPEEKISVVYQPVAPSYYGPSPQPSPEWEGAVRGQELSTSSFGQSNVTTPSHLGVGWGEGPYMLYVGSINSRKNLLGAVKALEMLSASVRIPLYIVGGGREYKREVEQYIAAHNLEKWTKFLTNVSNEQLHELYRKARLFVYPSFYEGFGLPLVEARLSGCPVISSNVSSLPEAAGNHALLVDPSDISAIGKAMDSLITDDQLHDTLAQASREEAMQTLHPQVLASQLMGVYQKVVDSSAI